MWLQCSLCSQDVAHQLTFNSSSSWSSISFLLTTTSVILQMMQEKHRLLDQEAVNPMVNESVVMSHWHCKQVDCAFAKLGELNLLMLTFSNHKVIHFCLHRFCACLGWCRTTR